MSESYRMNEHAESEQAENETEWVELDFRATIWMPVSMEVECGDLTQAVQNEIGSAGVRVITAELIE